MKDRGTYSYPYLSGDAMQTIVETGALGTAVRVHNRPEYTADEARTVCRWVNGQDPPLVMVKIREADDWDPMHRQGMRSDRHHGGEMYIGDQLRKGLVPLPDAK